jgi:hypothetical protein
VKRVSVSVLESKVEVDVTHCAVCGVELSAQNRSEVLNVCCSCLKDLER